MPLQNHEAATRAADEAVTRLLNNQKLEYGSPYLAAQPPPTRQQVSAVLHALADHSLLTLLNSPQTLVLGQDRAHLGEYFARASAHGRFLQLMGDRVEALAEEEV